MPRLDNYNYMKNLTDWVSEEDIFNKDFVWPRQMEIHLPSNKEIACDFHCFYCVFVDDFFKVFAVFFVKIQGFYQVRT